MLFLPACVVPVTLPRADLSVLASLAQQKSSLGALASLLPGSSGLPGRPREQLSALLVQLAGLRLLGGLRLRAGRPKG